MIIGANVIYKVKDNDYLGYVVIGDEIREEAIYSGKRDVIEMPTSWATFPRACLMMRNSM